MTFQKDAATRLNVNTIGFEPLSADPTHVLDGDVYYMTPDSGHGSLRLNIGGATVKIYEDGEITTGADTTTRTIASAAKVV